MSFTISRATVTYINENSGSIVIQVELNNGKKILLYGKKQNVSNKNNVTITKLLAQNCKQCNLLASGCPCCMEKEKKLIFDELIKLFENDILTQLRFLLYDDYWRFLKNRLNRQHTF